MAGKVIKYPFSFLHRRNFSNKTKPLHKFQGCILGSLLGDCYGAPFKLSETVSRIQLQKYFDKLDGPPFKAPYKPFSSGSALTQQLSESLIDRKVVDPEDIAKRFAREYFTNPNRDYGSNLTKILIKLQSTNDLHGPAKEQYLGLGSYGNGAAVRVHPLVLFHYDNETKKLASDVENISAITHANKLAQNGAILQSLALKNALYTNLVDPEKYINDLLAEFKEFMLCEEFAQSEIIVKQLDNVKKLIKYKNVSEEEVVNVLGHSKVAAYSIPTAIFCFLKSFENIPGVNTENNFRRAVQYSILLGGDADGIGAMTGALAGAFYGRTSVSDSMISHCENFQKFSLLADKLYSL